MTIADCAVSASDGDVQEILRPLFKRSDLINKYQVTLTLYAD